MTTPVLTLAILGHRPDPQRVTEVAHITNDLVSMVGFDMPGTLTAQRLQEIAEEVSSPFVVLAEDPDALDLRSLVERAALLVANPSSVLVYGPTTVSGPVDGATLPPGWAPIPATPFGDLQAPAMIVGRKILLHMMGAATNVVGRPETTVVRATALRNRPSIPVQPFGGGAWHLHLWVRLLAAGNAIYSPSPAKDPRTADQVTAAVVKEVAWWPTVVHDACRLGVLDAADDLRAAIGAYDHRYGLSVASGLMGPELVEVTAGERSRILTQLHDAPIQASSKLRLHAVVIGRPPPLTIGALGEAVVKVTAMDVDAGDLLEPRCLPAALADRRPLPAPVADVACGSDLPLLIMGPDERLDVRDIDQFRRVMPSLAAAGDAGVIRVRGGWSRRLWPSGTVTGRSSARPVYSAIVHLGSDREWLPQPTQQQLAPHGSRRRRFVVAALSYTHRSAGIAALHRLCDLLRRIGVEAHLKPLGADNLPLPPGQPFATNPEWETPLVEAGPLDEDTIVVYPEVVTGNPFDARNVVRWLLNRPGTFTGRGMEEGPDDLQVAFDASFGPGLPVLRLPQVDPRTFFPKDVPGQGGLLWVYKGQVPNELERGGLVEVLNDWPSDKDRLASLLRRSAEFVSCDWCSVLTHEAAMCGTPALLVRGSHGDYSAAADNGEQLGPEWLDLHSMLRLDGTAADGASDGSTSVFHAYLDQVATWAQELTDFVTLAEKHFDQVAQRVVA